MNLNQLREENTIYTTMRIARWPMRCSWPCGTRKINWWTQRSSGFAVLKFWERKTSGCRNANWRPWSASANRRTVQAEAGARPPLLSRGHRVHHLDEVQLLHQSSCPAPIRPLRLMHTAPGLEGQPIADRPAHLLLVPGPQQHNLFAPSSPTHLFDLPTHHTLPSALPLMADHNRCNKRLFSHGHCQTILNGHHPTTIPCR